MKQIEKILLRQPLAISFNKINQNNFSGIQSKNFLYPFHYLSYKIKYKRKVSSHEKKMQVFQRKIVFQSLKKRHLNLSKSWIIKKYSLFLLIYTHEKNQKRQFQPNSSTDPFLIKTLAKKSCLNFFFLTKKLPNIPYPKLLLLRTKKIFLNTHSPKINEMINQNKFKGKKNSLQLSFLKSYFNTHKLNFLKKESHNYKNILNTGTGYGFLVLLNVNPYSQKNKTNFNIGPKQNFSQKRKIWTIKQKSSQILTTFLLTSKNQKIFWRERKVWNFWKHNSRIKDHFNKIQNQTNFLTLDTTENLVNFGYPSFLNFQSKIKLIETSQNKDSMIL